MSRATNNYKTTNLDFIKTIAEIAEPFNSSFLKSYDEYEENISAYEISDERECFLSVLNKIGEDGCQVLTDRVVNYVDDISNIDTTVPSALLSQAESLGYPYKDKKTVEQLSRLTKCSPLLQSLVWATSTNSNNSKTILHRLNVINDNELNHPDISAEHNTDRLNSKISSNISSILYNDVFNKKYLYLDKNDKVSNISGPSVIDFSWIMRTLFEDSIIKNVSALNKYNENVIDFGKYNNTIFSIVCYTYLMSKLYSNNKDEELLQANKEGDKEQIDDIIKKYMPFVHDNRVFDPLQAAWSIIYDNATITDYDSVFHDVITDFIKCFNEKLNSIAYDALMQKISSLSNTNARIALKLNANSFTYQQNIVKFINDVRTLFAIDIRDFVEEDYINTLFSIHEFYKHNFGFSYLEDIVSKPFSKAVNWNSYIESIIAKIFKLGKQLRTLREDLRVMTLRNSYKGTAALIQFATFEYLRDCIEDLIYNAQEEYNLNPANKNKPHVSISPQEISSIIDILENGPKNNSKLHQSQINVNEYWDYTEYFNRTYDEENKVYTDWNKPDGLNEIGGWLAYGSLKEEDIFDFYTKLLQIPKEIYTNQYDVGGALIEDKNLLLKQFLKHVYDTGIFSVKERTNSNYEAIYSGDKNETTNVSPWVAWKNKEFISKQVHPYIWNFTRVFADKLYKSGAVNAAIQNTEYELLSKHISKGGNIVDQFKLSENFVDSSGYVTRYENDDHGKNEVTKSYDGIVYPRFAWDLVSSELIDASITDISTQWNDKFYQKWYLNQGLSLSEYESKREISNLYNYVNSEDFKKSVNFENESNISVALQNYSIDKFSTVYGVMPNECDNGCVGHQILYKENRYPYMRPLINQTVVDDISVNLGMLFLKADNTIDTDITEGEYCINNDKFPRIVISEDGTHILLRMSDTELRSYNVTTHKNINDEFEKALKLNTIISCDAPLFDSSLFNDSMIKTIDDSFYILIPKYNASTQSYDNYLIFIKNGQSNILVSKESFINADNTDLFSSGLIRDHEDQVLINSYFVKKSSSISDNINEISAVYSNEEYSVGNHKTTSSAFDTGASLDILNQFVQMYTSKYYSTQRTRERFANIAVNNTDLAYPNVNLSFDNIDNIIEEQDTLGTIKSNITIDNGFIAPELWNSTEFPAVRVFNINSDAGFNPVYIGEVGKMIINNIKDDQDRNLQTKQMALAKSTGAAFELLGPENDFESKAESENGDETLNDDIEYSTLSEDNIAFGRIHEFYSTNITGYSQSYNKANTAYRYGYASIIENANAKNDIYRIKSIQKVKFTTITADNTAVKTSSSLKDIEVDEGYDYNRIYMFLGANNILYSITPRKYNTYLQNNAPSGKTTEFNKIATAISSNTSYAISCTNTRIIDRIILKNHTAGIYGNVQELINSDLYLVHVEGKGDPNIVQKYNVNGTEVSVMPSPNFMLPTNELRTNLTNNIKDNSFDFHMHVPHVSVTENYMDITKNAATSIPSNTLDINNRREISSGSLVFTITETDSDKMNQQIPDQCTNDLKLHSVTVEAINDYFRFNELKNNNKNFDTLDYKFIPWKIVDLSLKRSENSTVEYGFENKADSIDNEYVIQPYRTAIRINQDDSNKYTISFWRKAEDNTNETDSVITAKVENTLPNMIKTTSTNAKLNDGTTVTYGPIYANDRESIGDILKNYPFYPQLRVQWEYDSDGLIKLRFNNAENGDAAFVNTAADLEYKSLSIYENAIDLKPGENGYLDIVAPYHITVGRTVFYNIPIMRVLVTNISDDKPKFMLTILNDRVDKQISLESNNYALVFVSSSEPQLSNSDNIYVTAYVAPLISTNQTKPPSIANAIPLSELAFNFDVANILNKNDIFAEDEENIKALVDPKYINIIMEDNTLSPTASAYVNYNQHIHQIRVSEPYGLNDVGFNTINIKINLSNMTNYTLKNTLLTAHGDVVAYNKDKKACNIIKIFGCSLYRIGKKHVLSVKKGFQLTDKVLSVTQNSGRETALLVNPDSVDTIPKDKCLISFVNWNNAILSQALYEYTTPSSKIVIPQNPTRPSNAQYTYTFMGWTPTIGNVLHSETYKATYLANTRAYEITWLNDDLSEIDKTSELYGVIPQHDNPVKPSDTEYNYVFNGWNPPLSLVSGATTYTATYKNNVAHPHLSEISNEVECTYATGEQEPCNFTLFVAGPWKARIEDIDNILTNDELTAEVNNPTSYNKYKTYETTEDVSAQYNALEWIRLDDGSDDGATEISGNDTSLIKYKILSQNTRGIRSGKIIISRPDDYEGTDPFTPLEYTIIQKAEINITDQGWPNGQRGYRTISKSAHDEYNVRFIGNSTWNISTSANWLTIVSAKDINGNDVDPAAQQTGNVQLTYAVTENSTGSNRTADIYATNADNYAVFARITQTTE